MKGFEKLSREDRERIGEVLKQLTTDGFVTDWTSGNATGFKLVKHSEVKGRLFLGIDWAEGKACKYLGDEKVSLDDVQVTLIPGHELSFGLWKFKVFEEVILPELIEPKPVLPEKGEVSPNQDGLGLGART